MDILVAYASKYGSTRDIAEHIALILRREGLSVEVKDAEVISSLYPYQAVIIGSALYFDNWLPAAAELLESFQDELAKKPVWLFSSGIIGEGDFKDIIEWYYPPSLKPIIKTIQPKDMALFGGKVDAKELELSDWLMNPGLRTETGDYRNWKEIENWAMQIAHVLKDRKGVTMRVHPYFTKEDAKHVGDILKINWSKIDLEQFRKGMDIELEHGRESPLTDVTHDDAVMTGKIALAHLNEYPDYYTRLEKMEAEAEAYWKSASKES